MQINAISILLKYIVTLKLAVGCDLLTGSFSCRMAKYILKKKMAFSLSSYIWSHHNISLPKMSQAQLLDVFVEQHLCNSVWFDLGAGVRCVPSGSWLRHRELGRKRGISQKVGCQISGYASEIPQQLWIRALFQLSGVSVEVGIWREAVPAPWMPGKAMAALQDLAAHAGICCWQAAAFAASWVQLLGIVNLLPFVVRVLPFPPT